MYKNANPRLHTFAQVVHLDILIPLQNDGRFSPEHRALLWLTEYPDGARPPDTTSLRMGEAVQKK
jgi:hypothetical protein